MRPSFLDDMGWAMGEVYGAVTDRILINLARYFKYLKPGEKIPGSFEYQARMLAQMGQVNRETAAIIAQYLGGADEALRDTLQRAILEGLKDEEPALKRAAARGFLQTPARPEVAPGMMQAFSSYYRQASDKLNLVNTTMLQSTQAAYQGAVADVANKIAGTQTILNVAAGETIAGVSTFNQALNSAVKKMVDNGLTGFVDSAGRNWSPEAYVAMDIRTTTANTARDAVLERNQEYGNDLYQVSTHDGARPLCYPWQGKVISTSGRRGTTEDLDGNQITIHSEDEIESFRYGGGLFGVNCGHYPMVFIPGFSTIKGQPQSEEENAKAYQESQQQRALERKVRAEKRDLEVLKAQGASEDQIKAQREKVRQASQNVQEFCNKTGRARHRDREYTPVNATFPDKSVQRGGVAQNVASQATQAQPKMATIGNATTADELWDAAKNEYGVTVSDSVKQLDFSMTKDAMIGIKRITDDFPEVGDAFAKIEVSKSGVMSCSGDKITFNASDFTNRAYLEAKCRQYSDNGWWPKNTDIPSIGTHEAAHGIEWFLDENNPSYTYSWERIDAWNKCTEAKSIVSQACKNVKKTQFGHGLKNADIIKSISRYAQENASETLAEAFADYYTNGAAASPMSKEVVKLTTERYKLYGGKGNGV